MRTRVNITRYFRNMRGNKRVLGGVLTEAVVGCTLK
jgi:hypothetical protein